MIPNERRTALATQCLWSLQEAATEIEALLLTHVDGLAWTTTLQGDESTQRLAAVSTAMFLLGEEASESWGRGESKEVFLKLSTKDRDGDGFPVVRHVLMRPIGMDAILVMVCRTDKLSQKFYDLMSKAETYLEEVMLDKDPPLPMWDER
jgi:predicted regulator of Ras-like GTPase activity (Roadblock/LC7/MglB family)